MANVLTNKLFQDMLEPYRLLGAGGNLYCALLGADAATYIGSGILTWSELEPYEVEGAGYVAGGKAITGVIVDGVRLMADTVNWDASTLTAQFAVVFDNTNEDSSNKTVLAIFDFGAPESTVGATFQVAWGVNGILNLAQG